MWLGDVLDALVDTLILTLLLVVPCAVLTAAGVLLWRHWRSAATALIALGFAATFLSVAIALTLEDNESLPPIAHALLNCRRDYRRDREHLIRSNRSGGRYCSSYNIKEAVYHATSR